MRCGLCLASIRSRIFKLDFKSGNKRKGSAPFGALPFVLAERFGHSLAETLLDADLQQIGREPIHRQH